MTNTLINAEWLDDNGFIKIDLPECFYEEDDEHYYYQLQLFPDRMFPYISIDSMGKLSYTVSYFYNGVLYNDEYRFSSFNEFELSIKNMIMKWNQAFQK